MRIVEKILEPFVRMYQKKVVRRRKEEQMTEKQKKLQAFYEEIKRVRGFVKWLNNQFPNRKSRKAFWKNVSKGERLVEKTLDDLISKYKPENK